MDAVSSVVWSRNWAVCGLSFFLSHFTREILTARFCRSPNQPKRLSCLSYVWLKLGPRSENGQPASDPGLQAVRIVQDVRNLSACVCGTSSHVFVYRATRHSYLVRGNPGPPSHVHLEK